MTAKEYLGQAYRIDKRINSKLEQVCSLRSLTTKATSMLSDMPHNPSRNLQSTENVICKIVDLEKEINADIDILVDLKLEIIKVIRAVDNNEYRMILEKRYICDKSWPEIAIELGYHLRHLYRMHDEALKKVKIPEDVTKCHY